LKVVLRVVSASSLASVLDDILAIQPTTLEGFAVQVLAIVTAHDDLCDESDENETFPYG
jgi:hypothetical protein